jgi:hypothetical protein
MDSWLFGLSVEDAILTRTQEVLDMFESGEIELDIIQEELLIETAEKKGIYV